MTYHRFDNQPHMISSGDWTSEYKAGVFAKDDELKWISDYLGSVHFENTITMLKLYITYDLLEVHG